MSLFWSVSIYFYVRFMNYFQLFFSFELRRRKIKLILRFKLFRWCVGEWIHIMINFRNLRQALFLVFFKRLDRFLFDLNACLILNDFFLLLILHNFIFDLCDRVFLKIDILDNFGTFRLVDELWLWDDFHLLVWLLIHTIGAFGVLVYERSHLWSLVTANWNAWPSPSSYHSFELFLFDLLLRLLDSQALLFIMLVLLFVVWSCDIFLLEPVKVRPVHRDTHWLHQIQDRV